MPVVLSLNIARQTVPVDYAKTGVTAIGKRPVDGPLEVSPPGPKGSGGSGIHGDQIGDWNHHGGDYQAVYGYAREDLDFWQAELGVDLHNGQFGENAGVLGAGLGRVELAERDPPAGDPAPGGIRRLVMAVGGNGVARAGHRGNAPEGFTGSYP